MVGRYTGARLRSSLGYRSPAEKQGAEHGQKM
jgi:hypothetical protein